MYRTISLPLHKLPSCKYSLASIILFFCAGCTSFSHKPITGDIASNEAFQECQLFFAKLDQAVQQSGVQDAFAARIKHYPWLRVNRFLASYSKHDLDKNEFNAWIDRLQQLDLSARNVENKNLSSLTRESLGFNNSAELNAATSNCSTVMRNNNFHNSENFRKAIKVPTEYQSWKRVVGVYPLSSIGVFIGANKLKKEIKTTFRENADQELISQEFANKVKVYAPPSKHQLLLTQKQTAEILLSSAQNSLGIPEPNTEQRDKLFNTFAPVWAVETHTKDDLIGQPTWRNNKSVVNTNSAKVYRLISHTRYENKVLLQLNYIVWFPARTLTGRFDILGGHLDGITWRVTLAEDGSPLLYDSMHNCGCYHKFYPSDRLEQKPKQGYEEALFVPTTAPKVNAGERIVLKVANLTHYIEAIKSYQDLHITKATNKRYAFDDYINLQTITLTNGNTRSLFRPDGIIDGTERLERWILWPMGIPEPGALRQWGHHATAFVGQRHFDDPNLIERYFEWKDSK